MDHATIVALFSAPTGGRAGNDSANKVREQAIIKIINNDPSVADPFYNPLKAEWATWLAAKKCALGVPADAPISAKRRAGRKYNWDIDLYLADMPAKVEFKCGATCVQDTPQFLSLGADKPFHEGESYARYFYNEGLRKVCDIYGITLTMTEADYVAKVHGTSKKPALFKALYDAEAAGTKEQKLQKKAIVDQTITSWLESVVEKTDIGRITEAFQVSQAGKHFLLCKGGKLYSDAIQPEEQVINSVIGLRNGNIIMLQSARPGTTHEMLLRWKNHAGILYPAWQISIKRV